MEQSKIYYISSSIENNSGTLQVLRKAKDGDAFEIGGFNDLLRKFSGFNALNDVGASFAHEFRSFLFASASKMMPLLLNLEVNFSTTSCEFLNIASSMDADSNDCDFTLGAMVGNSCL